MPTPYEPTPPSKQDILSALMRKSYTDIGSLFSQNAALAMGGQGLLAQREEDQRSAAQQAGENARSAATLQEQSAAHAAQLAQQLQFHNQPSEYERLNLEREKGNDEIARKLDLIKMIGSGVVREAQPDNPNALQYGGKLIEAVPPEHQAGNFTFYPTEEDIKAYPWMGTSKEKGITMAADKYPDFLKALASLAKTNPKSAANYEALLNGQLDQMFPAPEDAKNLQLNKWLVHDALAPADGSEPDYKRAFGVMESVRQMFQDVDTENRKRAAENSPEAISKAARKAYAVSRATQKATQDTVAEILDDDTMMHMWQGIKDGGLTYQDALGRFDAVGKRLFDKFLAKLGEPFPIPLSPAAQKSIATFEPVLDQLKHLKAELAPLANDTSPGSMFLPRAQYALGYDGDNNGGIISMGEIERIRSAARIMNGLSGAASTLAEAQIHTPNFWLDSGKLMNDKLDRMIVTLDQQLNSFRKYGAKTGIVKDDGKDATHTAPAPLTPSLAPLVFPKYNGGK